MDQATADGHVGPVYIGGTEARMYIKEAKIRIGFKVLNLLQFFKTIGLDNKLEVLPPLLFINFLPLFSNCRTQSWGNYAGNLYQRSSRKSCWHHPRWILPSGFIWRPEQPVSSSSFDSCWRAGWHDYFLCLQVH